MPEFKKLRIHLAQTKRSAIHYGKKIWIGNMSKKVLTLLITSCLLFISFGFAQEQTTIQPVSFVVYLDKGALENHYIPSGWMGDYTDIVMDDAYTDSPHSGATCIKLTYSAKRSQGQGWAGVYWQNPSNNWGSKEGGFDLVDMNKLTVWMKGAKGGEIIDKIMVGGIGGVYYDSSVTTFGPIELTNLWQEYTINLSGKDLAYISGGFGLVVNADSNLNGATFYIDDITFETDSALGISMATQEKEPWRNVEELKEYIKEYLNSLSIGDLLINIPREMTLYMKERVEVRITEKMTENLFKGFRGRGIPQVEEIKVGSLMKAFLTGDNFDITAFSPDTQPIIGDKEFAQWEWDVTPLKTGVQTLSIVVSVVIEMPNGNTIEEGRPVFQRHIKVKIDGIWPLILRFLKRYWQWLIGIVIAVVGIIFGWRNKKENQNRPIG